MGSSNNSHMIRGGGLRFSIDYGPSQPGFCVPVTVFLLASPCLNSYSSSQESLPGDDGALIVL